jgi:hypothetical protein
MKSAFLSAIAGALLAISQTTEAWAQQAPVASEQTAADVPVARSFPVAYLRVGLGTSYDINKYYRCARLCVEYAPMLNQRLGLSGRLVGVLGKPSSSFEKQLPNQNYKAAYVEQEILFYPFGINKRVRFALGAGGFAGYYKKNGFSHFSAVSGEVVDYGLNSQQGVHAGYIGSLNLEAALGKEQRWAVGVKSTIQNGNAGVSTLRTHSLTLSRRL